VVIDTSAIVAVLQLEPEGDRFLRMMDKAQVRLLSVVTRVELSCVIEARKGEPGRIDLERFLERGAYEIVAATPDLAAVAIEAFRRFGKGRHPARLNIGDCFSYALAKATGYPLLYKGNDFALTDIPSALPRTP
jgi:ribonuclease VapC